MSVSEAEVAPAGKARPSWRDAVRGNVLAVGLVSLFTDFSSEMIFPLLPVFFTGLVGAGYDMVYVAIMSGLAEATASVLKLFSGRISDKLGKRKALVAVGYGISTVARPLMALAGAGWHVIALRVGDRVGKGIRTSPRDALIGDAIAPQYRGLAFSFHRVMDHCGAILGPVVSVLILYAMLGRGLWRGIVEKPSPEEMQAMRWLFGIALIPGLLAMLTIFGKVREIAPRPAERPVEGKAAGAWRRLPRRFYAYVGAVGLFSLGNSSDLFLVLYGMKLFNMGLAGMIGLWVALHVSKIVFSFPGGALSDRFGRRPMIVAGWSMYALVYLGMALVGAYGSQWHFWALIAAYGFYYGMSEGVEKAVVADFVPDSAQRGTAFGVYHATEGMAKLPASLMFGLFWLAIGPVIAFGIGAALAGAAVVLVAVLLSATPGPAEPKPA